MVATYYNTPVFFDGTFVSGASVQLFDNDTDVPIVITEVDIVGAYSFKVATVSDTEYLQNNYITCVGIFETGSFPGTNGEANTAGWLWYEAPGTGTVGAVWGTSDADGYLITGVPGTRRWRGQVICKAGYSVYFAWSYNSSGSPTPGDMNFSGMCSVFYDSVP